MHTHLRILDFLYNFSVWVFFLVIYNFFLHNCLSLFFRGLKNKLFMQILQLLYEDWDPYLL